MKAKQIAKEIKKLDLPVFVYGYWTQVTLESSAALVMNGVEIEGYIQTDKLKKPLVVGGRLIEPRELEQYKNGYILIKGCLEHCFFDDELFRLGWKGCKAVFEVTDLGENKGIVEPISIEYFRNHFVYFLKIYNTLGDSKSKDSYEGFLRTKLFGDNTKQKVNVEPVEYFFEGSPWDYQDDDIFVDCGAYDGDSMLSYINACRGKYKEIIACEPDKGNFKKLKETVKDKSIRDVIPLNIGVYEEKGVINFNSTETMESRVDSEGDSIEVDAIDNFCDGKSISIIKMDIEGCELKALKGARKTITESRPILMICAYHKEEDIISIFQYIESIVKGYRWYFRCHRPSTYEAVYYIVPEERITVDK